MVGVLSYSLQGFWLIWWQILILDIHLQCLHYLRFQKQTTSRVWLPAPHAAGLS